MTALATDLHFKRKDKPWWWVPGQKPWVHGLCEIILPLHIFLGQKLCFSANGTLIYRQTHQCGTQTFSNLSETTNRFAAARHTPLCDAINRSIPPKGWGNILTIQTHTPPFLWPPLPFTEAYPLQFDLLTVMRYFLRERLGHNGFC